MHRRGQARGMTLVEVLVAAAIIGVSVASLVSMWYFGYRMTRNNQLKGGAYSVARRTMERFRQTGFTTLTGELNAHSPNAVWTGCLYCPTAGSYYAALYYSADGSGESPTQLASSMLKVTAAAAADTWSSNAVAPTAIIAVDVTVAEAANPSNVLMRTGSYLVRSGL